MARQTFVKKPEKFDAIQFSGTNQTEMIAFCPEAKYEDGKLYYRGIVVDPTSWIVQDNAGLFQIMINQYFVSYFSLQGGPAAKPAPEE